MGFVQDAGTGIKYSNEYTVAVSDLPFGLGSKRGHFLGHNSVLTSVELE